MPSRDEVSQALLKALRNVSSLLEQACAIAVKEQDALVKNDAEALVAACRAQEDILRQIGESDQLAADAASHLAEFAGLDPDTTDTGEIAKAAGEPYAALIQAEIGTVSTLAENLHEEHETNQLLLENGLDIIACTLRTLASDSGPTSYSEGAALSGPQPLVLSLDRRA